MYPKLWKNGSDAEQPVVRHDADGADRRVDVGADVAVREHTPFGSPVLPLEKTMVSRSSRRVPVQPERPVEHPAGQQQHREEGADPLPLRDRLEHVFEVDHLHVVGQVERHAADEPLRRDDDADAGLPHRRVDRAGPGGVVQVHRRLAEEREGEVRQRPAEAGRQPDADVRGVAEARPQVARHAQRADERLAPRQRSGRAGGVVDDARAGTGCGTSPRSARTPGEPAACGRSRGWRGRPSPPAPRGG